jgi:NAD(P)-dependent dehydrogenase (short-subunit alcohol dehydrogenase family)
MFSHVAEASEGLHDTPKIVGLECDVTSEASVKKAFTRTIETFGRVDVAVAAAGKLLSLS